MIITQSPPQHVASYNSIPVGLYIQPRNDIENYMAKINIVYNGNSIISVEAKSETTALIKYSDPISYNVGDSIYLYDRTNDNNHYSGYYTILEIISTNDAIIDLTIDIPFSLSTGDIDTSYTYLYIRYEMEPNPENFINLDLHNTLKDYVGVGLISDGEGSTFVSGVESFPFGLIFGEEYNFVYNFTDNASTPNGLGFITTQYTDVNEIPFQIGDVVNIVQDPQEWLYDDNYFNVFPEGSLGFTSTNGHNFQIGDKVFVTGQYTYPTSNGYADVIAVPDDKHIVVNKTFPGSTPAEPGKIYGYPTPQNNGVATITDIYVDSGYMVIVVDKPYNEGTLPISGTMRLVNNKKFGNLSVNTSIIFPNDNRPIYTFLRLCRFDRMHFSRNNIVISNDNMDPYLLGDSNRLWSTILPQDSINDIIWNKIDRKSPGFILFRQQYFPVGSPILAKFVLYTAYDKQKNVLGQFYISSNYSTTDSNANTNGYALTSLYALSLLTFTGDVINVGSFDLVTDFLNIHYWSMQVYSDASDNNFPTVGDEISTVIRFELDLECTGLPTYQLTWLDSYGSYITYPFKYNTVQSTDVKRNNFYRNEFDWNNIVAGGRPPSPPTYISQQVQYETHRGENTYNVQARTKLQLTSGWLKDKENIIFEDLMKSADVYVSMEDIDMSKETKNNINTYPVILEPNNIEYKSNYSGDFIFNYSPEVRFAFNDYRFNSWNTQTISRGGK